MQVSRLQIEELGLQNNFEMTDMKAKFCYNLFFSVQVFVVCLLNANLCDIKLFLKLKF